MLLEAGFTVKSVDASDKMLKYAYKLRWQRHKNNPVYDDWGKSRVCGHVFLVTCLWSRHGIPDWPIFVKI